jgi:uncharacterized protein YbjT (DUF2867 family)
MYVVAGVSGNTGKVVAETLLAQKKPVRVIVRDAAKGAAWKERGAEVAVTELDDVAGLTRALRGATGAYLLLPPLPASTNARADNAKRTQSLVKAIDESGVPHVVFLSSIAAHKDAGTGPILSVHDAEIALEKTRAAVTFVRAAYFMENWGASLFALDSGALPTFLKADKAIPMIATHDIGTTAAKALLEGGKGHTVIELAGPRDYAPTDVAAALTRILGKTITAQEGPESAMIGALTGAGLNAHWAGLYQEMTHGLNTGHVVWEGGSARHVRGTTEIDAVLKTLTART